MPRLLPYAKPPFSGAVTKVTQERQPFDSIASAMDGASPEALSTTTARIWNPAADRSVATDRRLSMVSAADLYVTITTAISSSVIVNAEGGKPVSNIDHLTRRVS